MNKDPEAHQNCISQMKELDPTRLTTIAHVSMTPVEGDMHYITDTESYNHYFGWYNKKMEDNGPWFDMFHEKHPNICIGVSEYGCEGIITYHGSNPKCKDYSEDYQALYHEHMAKVLAERPYIWSSHVWNMFDFGCAARDEGGVRGRNNKGLVTMDRKTKKDSYYIYKAYWNPDPMVHIAGKRYAQRAGETTEIKVYSNQGSVALYLNGTLAPELEFPEGKLSIKSKIKQVYANEEAWAMFKEMLPMPLSPEHGMWGMISNFTIEGMIEMGAGEVPEAALAMLNDKLNEFDDVYVEEE